VPLRETRPWARFIGIISILVGAFSILASVGIVFAGGLEGMPEEVPAAAIAGAYVFMGVLYIVPGLFLNQYASAIAHVEAGGGVAWMVQALEKQRSFWRFAGVLTLILMLAIVLGVCAGVMVGATASS